MSDEEKNGKQEDKQDDKKNSTPELVEVAPIERSHTLELKGRALNYKTHTGMMPLKNNKGEIEAEIFFMSYTLDHEGDLTERPLIFVFNGGPGSSSVWLHMGTCGPYRVKMHDEGWMPAPPFRLEPNEQTWLELADLVFIDPVGTGYSRAKTPDDNKKYWTMDSDLDSVTEFIRLYLTRFQRWTSPLFLSGESYGTFRAAGLSERLIDKGIALNGIFLISTVLNMQSLRSERGNDLPYIVFLPTFALTARYHGRLAENLQNKPLAEFIAEVESWAETTYATALMMGDRLTDAERDQIAAVLASYTGLSQQYIYNTNLRINIHRFCKELLRNEGRTVGRLDSRFKGRDADSAGEYAEHDPSLSDIIPPYTSTFNQYVRTVLGYETDRPYEILSGEVISNWEYPRGVFPDTSEALRKALARNPHMQIWVGRGLYDMATPHFAAQYTLTHMDIDRELRGNVHYRNYESGHMFYLEVGSLAQLKADVAEIIGSTANNRQPTARI